MISEKMEQILLKYSNEQIVDEIKSNYELIKDRNIVEIGFTSVEMIRMIKELKTYAEDLDEISYENLTIEKINEFLDKLDNK